MASVSVNLPPALLRDIDAMVAESNVYESRSHLVRVALREHRDREGDHTEFSKAA